MGRISGGEGTKSNPHRTRESESRKHNVPGLKTKGTSINRLPIQAADSPKGMPIRPPKASQHHRFNQKLHQHLLRQGTD